MLDEITAANLGLIESASVDLHPGLTVITGETGTGKTLMLGALRLLRGDKAGKGYIGPSGDRCDVAGRFIDGDDEVVARRTVDAHRSRAYLDDVATSVSGLSDAMNDRIAIVGQHDQLSLTTAAGVRALLDSRMTADDRSVVEDYEHAWNEYRSVLTEREALSGDTRSIERELDLLRYQVEEIDALGLDPDEADELKDRLIRLRNADNLQHEFGASLDLLGDDGATASIEGVVTHLTSAAELDDTVSPIRDRALGMLTEMADLARDIASIASSIDANGLVLEEAEQRQSAINDLRRKYGDSVKEVLAFRDDAADRAEELASALSSAETIDERLRTAESAVRRTGDALSPIRRRIGSEIADRAVAHLRDLGFRAPVVEIEVAAAEPNQHGCDRTTLLFASDAELAPGPVSAIASGGELSRLVLALTLASGAHGSALVAFDEVDAGVGGETALAMGRKLKELSQGQQVVCVTHLPQVAAFGDRHVLVTRSGTTASAANVDGDARVEELSRMLAGLSTSEKGREHAAELLSIASES